MNTKLWSLTFSVALAIGAGVLMPLPAAAEVFKWQDPTTKISVTYPDTWRRVGNQQPDDIITIAAPGHDDYASCRLRVREDRRFVIYPRSHADAIQRINYSRNFWDVYVGEFDGAVIHETRDNGGLGNAFASWADVSFISPGATKVQKRGIMYAGIYNDKAYIYECSAEVQAFDRWYHPFLSFLKSVDMRHEYATEVNGNYRPFQNDRVLKIYGQKPIDLYIY
jgi:hypothetical protein